MKTLGLFAKQPVPGRVKTRLAVAWGAEPAAQLYECFVRDLLERFAETGDRRVVGFAPDSDGSRRWFASSVPRDPDGVASGWELWPQPDLDLGGRMTAFFETWCAAPDDRTLLIGSDSPSLPAAALDDAWRQLESRDCVLGPAADGGYWLIGLRGPFGNRHRNLFHRLDWSTSAVLGQTVERLRAAGLSLGLLSVWYDVDTPADVETLHGHLAALRLAREPIELPATIAFLESRLRSR